jgi:hypothetical protein
MTIDRHEVVIEGSNDGVTWLPYEWRYKPGNPARAPGFVAPHQPRADFQAWFLTLGGRDAWFGRLVERLRNEPETVAALFSSNPFPDAPPRDIRVRSLQYRFTDLATGRATGLYWSR